MASNTEGGTQNKSSRNRVLRMTIWPKMKVVIGELKDIKKVAS
jgi:hypothetical protein